MQKSNHFRFGIGTASGLVLAIAISFAWMADRRSLLRELRAARLKDENYELRLENIAYSSYENSDDAFRELIFALGDPYAPVSVAAEKKLQSLAQSSRAKVPPPNKISPDDRMLSLNLWSSWFLKARDSRRSNGDFPFGQAPEAQPDFGED